VSSAWTPDQLRQLGAAGELEIAVRRADGSLRRWVPIWVVCFDQDVCVRTWYRRPDGWFGNALQTRRARIRVPGVEADVSVTDVSSGSTDLRASVDDAYRSKYGHVGDGAVERMVADSAAATTLLLQPNV
jgi:hypothetical protein